MSVRFNPVTIGQASYLIFCLAVAASTLVYSQTTEFRTNQPDWPREIKPSNGDYNSPGPWRDPDSETIWPNLQSRSNSDGWIVKNHDRIRKLNPRVVVLNFSNEHPRAHLDAQVRQLIQAIAESSRFHGYADAKAPVFLQYELFKFVDLRDTERKEFDSRKVPVKDKNRKSGINFNYGALFSEQFTREFGVVDPRNSKRYLRLDELVDAGYVHEVWFFVSGREEPGRNIASLEVVEEKPVYDELFQRTPNKWVQAGNGGDDDQPWTGRSLRINSLNASRGIGCAMENLGHGLEGLSNSGAIPYFTKYFREYAGFDLDRKYNLPFNSFYGMDYGQKVIEYPDEKTMIFSHRGKTQRVENYISAGGNVHFPPNGRSHYDLRNDKPVLSTIEDWRTGSGPGGIDAAQPFTNKAFEKYRNLAPDCMGAWLVYWRQNMPGLDNRQKADGGASMKNWWPFLFY